MGTFAALRDRGATLVVSTNQLDEAVHCDRLAILREGRLLAEDTPGSLLDRGRTRVIAATKRSRDARVGATTSASYRAVSGGGIESVRIERDTLEDVMLRLVEEEEP